MGVQFLDDLFKFCGVSALKLDDLEQGRRNRGLSTPSLAIARRLNRVLGSSYNPAPLVPQKLVTWKELRRFLQRRIDPRLGKEFWNESRRPLIPIELVEQLEAHYRPHNERLEREYGISFTTQPQ